MLPTRWKAMCGTAIALYLLIGFGPTRSHVEAKIVFTSKRNGDTDFHIYLMDDEIKTTFLPSVLIVSGKRD